MEKITTNLGLEGKSQGKRFTMRIDVQCVIQWSSGAFTENIYIYIFSGRRERERVAWFPFGLYVCLSLNMQEKVIIRESWSDMTYSSDRLERL